MYQNIFWDPFRRKVHLWDDKLGYRKFPYKKYAYVKDSYGQYVSLYGDKLKKIYRWDEEHPGLFESDVNPEIRTLVDKYSDSDEVSVGHKRLYFDMFNLINRQSNSKTKSSFLIEVPNILEKAYSNFIPYKRFIP